MPPKNTAPAAKILTIKFDGPHPTCTETKDVLEDCKHRKLGGIYFWAIQVGESYRITHIGQTGTSFYQRMKEHIINTLGGNYRISDSDALKRGESKILWDGLWREGTRGKLPEFLRDSSRLFEEARRNLQIERVFVAPLDASDRLRRRIEGALALQIRKDKTASSLFPPDIRVLGRLTTETSIPVKIVMPVKVLGVPDTLEI